MNHFRDYVNKVRQMGSEFIALTINKGADALNDKLNQLIKYDPTREALAQSNVPVNTYHQQYIGQPALNNRVEATPHQIASMLGGVTGAKTLNKKLGGKIRKRRVRRRK